MTASNVQPMIEPDGEQMRRHLEHLFGGDLDGCHEGRIELAWTDRKDRRLRHAAIFGTDELDDMAARAVRENRLPNQNVYVGQALRRPDTPPFGRCKDEDFFALTCFYVDLDDDVVATAKESYRHRGCPPTAVVVTGRHPHVRAQMLWRQETPERDPEACRRQNRALAHALGGDPSVVNPGRVMRLGGSIAWPVKPGRVIERTELVTFKGDRPRVYYPGQLAKAFPPAEPPATATSAGQQAVPTNVLDDAAPRPAAPPRKTAGTPDRTSASATTLNIGSEFDGVTVEACLAAVRAGDHWHDNLVRLTGHWIARGWSDAEILTAAEALTLSGYTPEQTRREVAAVITGGRRKWNVPNPEHEVGEVAEGLRLADWTADRYAGEAAPIEWLCAGTIPLAAPVLFAAMGGLGKSYLAIDLALQIAVGVCGLAQPKTILGGPVALQGSAVVISAEDSFNAIHRRLNRIDPKERRLNNPEKLIIVPLPDAGGPRPLIVGDGGDFKRTPFFFSLADELAAIPDLRLVVIDPLQAFVMADVNADPAAGQYMWSAFAQLCAATGATVLVTHHMRKDGLARIESANDARETIRGSTALVDGARLSYALWKVDEQTSRALCLQLGIEYENGRIVNGAVVKANDEANVAVQTYARDPSGLLVDCSDRIGPMPASPGPTMEKARMVLAEIDRRFKAGNPFSHSHQGGSRHVGPYIRRTTGLSKRQAEYLLWEWMDNGVVAIATCDRKNKLQGLKVMTWL